MKAPIQILLTVLLLASVSVASASIVIHDGQPGIVATSVHNGAQYALDSMGQVWDLGGYVWNREGACDPPVPLESIKFWERDWLITTDNYYWYHGTIWYNFGEWPPGISGLVGPPLVASPAIPHVVPNPSAGSCLISFQIKTAGPVSVGLFDVSGRLVRQLLSGPYPAGAYSLTWDGKDDNGSPVPAGVYLARVETGAGATTGMVVLTQ